MATAPVITDQPFLSGVFEPTRVEVDETDLPVIGEIPRALSGTYLRNGANPKYPPAGQYHLFDGDGMLHSMTFEDGRVRHRNRWIQTPGLAAEDRAGRALFAGMTGAFKVDVEATGGLRVKNSANTHVIRHAGRILCLWEGGPPTEVTLDLETVGPWTFDGQLEGAMTAHPKIDPETGELLFFAYSGTGAALKYHVVDAQGKYVRRVDIDLPAPVMMHDFEVTREHAVFLDAPAVWTFEEFMKGGTVLTWKPENGTRFGVLPRDGSSSDVVWIETDPCYVFHFMNAFTEGNRVIVDGCRIPKMDIGLDGGPDGPEPEGYLTRFTLDLEARSCTEERLHPVPGDFARVPDAVAGLPYRYGYMATYVNSIDYGGLFDSITKVDHQTGEARVQDFGGGRYAGEPIFAPDPTGSGEDDGWILTFLTDQKDYSSEFVILDARNIDAEPVARIPMPNRVPFGFHGSWLPADEA